MPDADRVPREHETVARTVEVWIPSKEFKGSNSLVGNRDRADNRITNKGLVLREQSWYLNPVEAYQVVFGATFRISHRAGTQ